MPGHSNTEKRQVSRSSPCIMRSTERGKQGAKWHAHKVGKNGQIPVSASGLFSGDAGIFVTCDKGQEGKCLREANDLLSQYVDAKDEGDRSNATTDTIAKESKEDDLDVESSIQKELDSIKSSAAQPHAPLSFVKLDIPCVSFVKTAPGIDPVSLVHAVCKDAQAKPDQKRSRFIKRMTPVTMLRKILPDGLEHVCVSVLKPHFHSGGSPRKFAIRPTMRNNDKLHRDEVIQTVAKAVGPPHTVDLKHYDLLILVDVYRNICGMSVVGSDFEELKKFNLAELYLPTQKPGSEIKRDSDQSQHLATAIKLEGSSPAAPKTLE